MTKTDICNKALTLIGAAPIANLEEDTENAKVLNRVYDLSLRSILSECLWTFATKRSLLSVSADTLAWYDSGCTIVYVRPTDVIRIFETNDQYALWKIEGDYIVSDTSGLGIRYVYYLDSPSKYTASFIDAFVDILAANICFSITNSKTTAEGLLEKYHKVSLLKAKSENSQIGSGRQMIDDAWELSKYTNGNNA